MVRWMPCLWLWTALVISLVASPRVVAAAEPAPAGKATPLAPLFGAPPLAAGEEDSQPASEAGVAELSGIETVSFNAPADEGIDADEEEEDEEAEEVAEEPIEAAEEPAAEEAPPAPPVKKPPTPAKKAPPAAAPTEEKEVETATFSGIRPGESTLEQVHKAWGKPSQSFEDHGVVHQIFAVEPFKEIDVSYHDQTVAAIVIFMEQSFAAPDLAQQLGLDNLQAVIIPDSQGKWLGQSYPERGVMFGFDPEQAKEKLVAQIVLEPISGLPFLLRAEVRMQRDYGKALSDLDYAVQLDPKLAKAHALRAQALMAMMRWDEAGQAIDAAITLEPKNFEFRLTKTELLRQTGDFAGAVALARKTITEANGKPLSTAPALVELARAVGEGPDRDYRRAADYALEAIKLTEELVKSEQPRTRKAARIAALDAHLELSNAIAWGFWRQKDKTVPKWLDKAQELADQLADEDQAGDEYRLRVAAKALAACVGLKGAIDPTPWVKALQDAGAKQLTASNDPVRRTQLEWQVGLALYDAMQAYHQLEAYPEALEVGTLAASAIEHVNETRQPLPGDSYLLGRLYFRLGTLHVAQGDDHEKAVAWFEKARPMIESPLPDSSMADVGRQGETMVSMAVSYWSVGRQNEAIALTDAGAKLMQQGVDEGVLDADALKVPYNNLATMHRFLGDEKSATKYTGLAEKSTGTKLK